MNKSLLQEVSSIAEFTRAADIIRKECKPTVRAYESGAPLLYRGVRKKPKHLLELETVRKDRKVLGGGLVDESNDRVYIFAYRFIDEWFTQHFGRPIRRECVFASANKAIAENYGSPTVVFPRGNTSYIQSSNINDLYEHLSEELDNLVQEYVAMENVSHETVLDDEGFQELAKRFIFGELDGGEFRFIELDEVKRGAEVMILCDEFYIVNALHKDYERLMFTLDINTSSD